MTHPLIPKIIDLATPIAENLGLELVEVVLQTNKNPTVLRVDISNREKNTSLDDCERMSRALEEQLDAQEIISFAYVLEISSPGINRQLTTDREFIAFKGFPVIVVTTEPYKQHKGKLLQRTETEVILNLKGKEYAIPREVIAKVQLDEKS